MRYYLATVFAKLVQKQLFRRFHLIFGRDVVPVLTNRTDKTDFYSMFSLFCHIQIVATATSTSSFYHIQTTE